MLIFSMEVRFQKLRNDSLENKSWFCFVCVGAIFFGMKAERFMTDMDLS